MPGEPIKWIPSKPLIFAPYFLIIILAVPIGIIWLDTTLQDNKIEANRSNIATNTDQLDLQKKFSIQIRNNANDRLTALEEYDQTITQEIAQVNRALELRYPQPNIPQDIPQTGTGATTPTITIHLDSTEFFRGDIIWVTGVTSPRDAVQAILKAPDGKTREPNSVADQQGQYKIGMFTTLNDLKGDYTVYVKAGGQTSETLRFELK